MLFFFILMLDKFFKKIIFEKLFFNKKIRNERNKYFEFLGFLSIFVVFSVQKSRYNWISRKKDFSRRGDELKQKIQELNNWSKLFFSNSSIFLFIYFLFFFQFHKHSSNFSLRLHFYNFLTLSEKDFEYDLNETW